MALHEPTRSRYLINAYSFAARPFQEVKGLLFFAGTIYNGGGVVKTFWATGVRSEPGAESRAPQAFIVDP